MHPLQSTKFSVHLHLPDDRQYRYPLPHRLQIQHLQVQPFHTGSPYQIPLTLHPVYRSLTDLWPGHWYIPHQWLHLLWQDRSDKQYLYQLQLSHSFWILCTHRVPSLPQSGSCQVSDSLAVPGILPHLWNRICVPLASDRMLSVPHISGYPGHIPWILYLPGVQISVFLHPFWWSLILLWIPYPAALAMSAVYPDDSLWSSL